MDLLTKMLYTQLKKHGNEFHEGRSYVSHTDALESPNAIKRTLEKERFGNTRFDLPKYCEEPSNVYLRVSAYCYMEVLCAIL